MFPNPVTVEVSCVLEIYPKVPKPVIVDSKDSEEI